jgi:hypothetical protein
MQKQASVGQWQHVQMMVPVTLIIIMKAQITGSGGVSFSKKRVFLVFFT